MHGEQASIGRRGLRTVGRVLTWPIRRWRIIALMLAGLFLAYYVFGYVMVWRLEQQKDALREAGIPLQFSEMDIPPASYGDNAAVYYEYVYARILAERPQWVWEEDLGMLVARLDDSYNPDCSLGDASVLAEEGPLTEEEISNLEAYFEDIEPLFQIIRDALKLPHCQFHTYEHLDHVDGACAVAHDPLLDKLPVMRELTRYISYKVQLEKCQDNLETAWLWAIRGLRLTNDLIEDPYVNYGFKRSIFAGMAFASVRDLLSQYSIPGHLRPALLEELTKLGDKEPVIYFIKGEICGTLNVVEASMTFWNARVVAPIAIKYIEANKRIIEIIEVPDRKDRMNAFNALGEEFEQMGERDAYEWHVEELGISPTYSEVIYFGRDAYGKMLANAELCRISLALKDYRRDNGGYPASLEALVPEYATSIPMDPFSGDPYVYERDETGFRIYSVGLNQADDGGLAGGGKDGDIVWCAQ